MIRLDQATDLISVQHVVQRIRRLVHVSIYFILSHSMQNTVCQINRFVSLLEMFSLIIGVLSQREWLSLFFSLSPSSLYRLYFVTQVTTSNDIYNDIEEEKIWCKEYYSMQWSSSCRLYSSSAKQWIEPALLRLRASLWCQVWLLRIAFVLEIDFRSIWCRMDDANHDFHFPLVILLSLLSWSFLSFI